MSTEEFNEGDVGLAGGVQASCHECWDRIRVPQESDGTALEDFAFSRWMFLRFVAVCVRSEVFDGCG